MEQSNVEQHRENVEQRQDNADQLVSNEAQFHRSALTNRGITWGLILQIATILVAATIAYASLQTKSDSKLDNATNAAALKTENEFNARTYMTKELSLDRWTKNDRRLESIEKKLDDILKEMRKR